MNINFKAAVVVLAGVFTLVFNSMAVAGTDEKNTNQFVELQYAGKSKEQPMFRLAINDKDINAAYSVVIREENGDVLYSEKVNGKATRTYMLNTDDSERILGTTFEVTNKATNVTSIYKISKLSKTVEAVELAKL